MRGGGRSWGCLFGGLVTRRRRENPSPPNAKMTCESSTEDRGGTRRGRFQFRLRTLLIVGPLLAVLLGWVGTFLGSLNHAIHEMAPNAYAVELVASMVTDYMDSHRGEWPRKWDDLRESYTRRSYGSSLSFQDLQKRVEIDWNANPMRLATADETQSPPFHVIWLSDGGSEHWSGSEPNSMVLKYLKRKTANTGQPQSPASRDQPDG